MSDLLKKEEVGLKSDEGKVRVGLIPPDATIEKAKVYTFGAIKYGPYNWEKGILYSRVFDAMMRHLLAFQSGETHDPETGLHHLAHVNCCGDFLLAYELRNMGETWNDFPAYQERKKKSPPPTIGIQVSTSSVTTKS